MRIQSKYMSFNNRWTICSSFDFQAHQQHSQRWCFSQTALRWFELLLDFSPGHQALSLAHRILSPVHLDLSPALLDLSPALPDLTPALPGAPRYVVGAPRLTAGAPRSTQSSLRHSEVFPKLSKSLPWYSCSGHQRSQLIWRPAGMPS